MHRLIAIDPGETPAVSFPVYACPVGRPTPSLGVIGGHAHAFEAKRSHPIHAFKYAVHQAAVAALGAAPAPQYPKGVPVALRLDFYMPRPERLNATIGRGAQKRPKYDQGPLPCPTKPDADNLVKGFCDAVKGVLWADDCQVASLFVRKQYAEAGGIPRVEVRAEAVGGAA